MGTGQGITFAESYDWAGRISQQTRNSGASLTVTSNYGYNAENSVTGLDEFTSASTIASYALSYDPAQELTQSIDHSNTTSFAYDNLGELTNYGTAAQTYTPAGNVSGDTVTLGNEVTYDSAASTSYGYDGAGNETKSFNVSSGVSWAYTYDECGIHAYKRCQEPFCLVT